MPKKDNLEHLRAQKLYDKLMNVKGVCDQPHFQATPSEVHRVQLVPDKAVSPAMFIADTEHINTYRAHPQTIRAVREDLFAAGEEVFEDLEEPYDCWSCKKKLDLQFWKRCPYCESEIILTN